MLRLLGVLFLATIAWLMLAGLDWVFGLGIVAGVFGLVIGILGEAIGLVGGVISVVMGAVGVALGAGAILIIPCLIVCGLIFLFKSIVW